MGSFQVELYGAIAQWPVCQVKTAYRRQGVMLSSIDDLYEPGGAKSHHELCTLVEYVCEQETPVTTDRLVKLAAMIGVALSKGVFKSHGPEAARVTIIAFMYAVGFRVKDRFKPEDVAAGLLNLLADDQREEPKIETAIDTWFERPDEID